MIEISGAGVQGLSCGIKLVESGFSVTIFEARQEIGNPVRSPGLISTLDFDMIEKTAAKKNEFGWAFRREWFEKLLAKKFVDLGGIIKLKTEGPKDSIDCTGGKSKAPGWPVSGTQYELVPWNGGIVIRTDIPAEFNLNQMSDDRFCFERGDGLAECWIRGELPRPSQGWLEILQGEHPQSPLEISADKAVLEGYTIAKNLIHSLREVS
jgi:hypothetical protein